MSVASSRSSHMGGEGTLTKKEGGGVELNNDNLKLGTRIRKIPSCLGKCGECNKSLFVFDG